MNARPRRLRYKRPKRLQAAKSWLPTYTGKNIVHGYRKYFGVNWKTAFTELEMLGVEISPTYKETVLRTVETQLQARREKAAQKNAGSLDEFQDEPFALIVGYTSGGAPYGITWEEWKELEQDDDPIPGADS
jgi:opacity protein-like surface antigen